MKKKYYFIWSQFHTDKKRLNYVLAENETEAREKAISGMRILNCDDKYDNKNIELIVEITDDTCCTNVNTDKEIKRNKMFPKIINNYIYISSGWVIIDFIEQKKREFIRGINKILGGK